MFEVHEDVLRLAVDERCIVWVSGELFSSSDDSSVVGSRVEMADMSEVINEGICLLFI